MVFVLVLLGLATLYIELNKDELIRAAVEEANQSINGTIDYTDGDVSFLSSFPDLRISLYDLNVVTDTTHQTPPLFQSATSSIDLSLLSLIRKSGPVIINALKIEEGEMYLLTREDGTTNYELFPESDTTTSQKVDFDISSFSIESSQIRVLDQKTKLDSRLTDLNLDGNVQIKDGITTIKSKATATPIILYNPLLPAYSCAVNLTSLIEINDAFDSIAVNEAEIIINDLPVSLTGLVTLLDDGVDYKIDLTSPSTDIKQLISLIPVYYKNKYDRLESTGAFTLAGNITGNTNWEYPIYRLQVSARNGSVSYPSLPRKIDELAFDLDMKNDAPSTAYSQLSLQNMAIRSAQNKLNGNVHLQSGRASNKSDIDIDTYIDLGDLAQAFYMDPESAVSGILEGDIKANLSINNQGEVSVNSDRSQNYQLEIRQFSYKDKSSTFYIKNGMLNSKNEDAEFRISDINYNNGFIGTITGDLKNPLALLSMGDMPIRGSISIDAPLLNLNRLAGGDTTSTNYTIPTTEIQYTFKADTIIQSDFVFETVVANGLLNNLNTTAAFTVGQVRGSRITGKANLKNVLGYGLNNEILSGAITMQSDQLRLDDWMMGETNSQAGSEDAPLIPDNIDLDIDYQSNKIQFKNLDILESLGQVNIKDQKIIFNSIGDIFGGKMNFEGTFDTEHRNGYHLDLGLQLNELQFGATAAKLKLFKDLIPIAALLEGTFSATLNWQSELNKNYIPNLNTLTAYGEIETKNGQINGQLPLDNFISRFVDIQDRNLLRIADAKKYFIIEDGKVMVRNIELKKGDLNIGLTGTHGFDQQLDYEIRIDIPKSKIKAGGVIDFVQDKINFSKILKAPSEEVYLQVAAYMGGTILKPTFSVKSINLKSGDKVESLGDQIKGRATVITDSLSTILKDTLNTFRNKLSDTILATRNKITKGVDSLRTRVNTLKDTTTSIVKTSIDKEKKELEEQSKKLLDSLKMGKTDSLSFSIDQLFNQRKGKLDSLKNKFPFGKKKKDDKKGGN